MKELGKRLRRFLLDLDARLDSAVYRLGADTRHAYQQLAGRLDRFHVGGVRRWLLVEPASEAATLGCAALVLLLALALPAFRETEEDWLRRSEISVKFLDRHGNEIGSRGTLHSDAVPLGEFPDHLIKAVLATEDRRFYEHFGIDVAGTLRAFTANARAGGVVQGGSSISQQLAKNLFLSNERTIERKVREAFLSLWLETRLSKNEILKLYLDRAYMGGGAVGVDAASHYYFGKSVREVNLAEAAMLAGLLKAPSKFAPHVNLPAARARANVVLDNLTDAGFMTEGQVYGARRNPATAIDRRDDRAPNYYLDWAFEEVKKIVEKFPKSATDSAFVVRTALDSALQTQADKIVDNAIRVHGDEYDATQGAAVVVDLDGAVRAMVGGRDYGTSQFNRAVDSFRQPGSSFKPYVYAAAFESGAFRASSIVVDSQVCLGNWCPQNYGRSFAGPVTLTQALVRSINTVPIKLSIALGDGNARTGRGKIVKVARGMGLQHPLTDSSTLPIGAAEVNVLEHTAAFATFPNLGKAVKPHGVLEVRNGAGDLLWRFDRDGPKPVQVLKPQVATDINMILNKAVEEGTGRRAMLDGIKAAGKTGTTNAYRDAWFVGYTGNFVAGVWFGNDDYKPMDNMTGGTLPAMTWRELMVVAHQGVEIKPIPGVQQPAPGSAPALLSASARRNDTVTQRFVLTPKSSSVLARIEQTMLGAVQQINARKEASGKEASGKAAQAAQGVAVEQVR